MTKEGGWLQRLRAGLSRTRSGLKERMDELLGGRGGRVDESVYEGLEEALILADAGMAAAMRIIDGLRGSRAAGASRGRGSGQTVVAGRNCRPAAPRRPAVGSNDDGLTAILVVGVNGAGKTTTVGKLAHRFRSRENGSSSAPRTRSAPPPLSSCRRGGTAPARRSSHRSRASIRPRWRSTPPRRRRPAAPTCSW